MTPAIRVLICDDHTLFREGLRALLAHESSLEVVGVAESGRQALDMVRNLDPDVVLMDIAMPDLLGYEATRRIRKLGLGTKILILTMHAEEESIARSLEAGASGYILKEAPATQLVYAIQQVRRNAPYYDPGVAATVVRLSEDHPKRPASSYDRLSGREREVLKLLAEGMTVKQIATHLDLSVKTVDTHKYNLMLKLDVHDRAQLVRYAIEHKIIRLSAL
jgi:two-component system response regulator NreC